MLDHATSPVRVRPSEDADVDAMLAIYEHHVSHGIGDVGAWVPTPFDAKDLKERRKNMRKNRLPHLVAEIGEAMAGYAYAVPFRKRAAYRYTVKHSIYVHPERLGRGVGRALLRGLIAACGAAGFRQMIGYIDATNAASLKLHEGCGFEIVGRLPAVAFRFDHWSDTIMVQRALGTGDLTPPGR